jgi:uncharacterized membrane protein
MNRSLERSLWGVFAALAVLAVWATLRGPGWGYPARDPIWLTIYALTGVLLAIHSGWAVGARRAAMLVGLLLCTGFAAEVLGLQRGLTIFGGGYEYGDHGPVLLDVPILIIIYWAVLGYAGHAMTQSFLAWGNRPKPSHRCGRWWLVPLLALSDGVFTMLIDLFMDPLMVRDGGWRWHSAGTHFGVPIGNFVGWVAVVALACGIFRAWEYVRPQLRRTTRQWPHLIAPLSYLATAGYLAVWAAQRQMPTLALVGLAAMGIPACASIAYCLLRRPTPAGAQ